MNSNVLVAGAGMVGSQVLQLLANESGVTPVALDIDFDEEFLSSIVDLSEIECEQGSILDREFVDRVLQVHDIDAIVNTAAVLPMRVGHDPHPGFFKVNAWGVPNLMFAAIDADVDRFIQFSTNGVYQFEQNRVDGPISEEYPVGLNQKNSYADSKATSESLLAEIRQNESIEGAVLRPGEIYGPVAEKPDDDPIYWKQMIDRAVRNEPFVLDEHPEHRLDWVYVKDVAKLATELLLAKNIPHFAYNASYGKVVGIYDIKDTLDDLYPDNEIELRNCERGGWQYPLDMSRAKEDFGYVPTYDLHEGVRDYARWYQGGEP